MADKSKSREVNVPRLDTSATGFGDEASSYGDNAADTYAEDDPFAEGDGEATRKIAPQQTVVPQGSYQANRRNGNPQVNIPRAMTSAAPGFDYETYASNVSGMGPARGMIPAQGYKRKRSVLNKIATAIGILFALALVAVIVLLGMLTVTEYRPSDSEDVAISYLSDGVVEPGQQISLITWNTGYCGLSEEADFFMDGGKNVVTVDERGVTDNMVGIEAFLAEQDPDIMFLQEVDVNSDRSYHIDQSQNIAARFSDSYSSAFATNYMVAYVPYPIPPLGQVYSGIQTESRFAADTATRIQLPCPFKWPTRIGQLKRCLLVERIPIGDGAQQLVLVNLHLEAYDDGEGKAEQTAELVRFMAREYEKGNYVIAGGDFNQTFSNVDTSAYPLQDGMWQCGSIDASSFAENWQLLMDPNVPTCRSLDRAYDANDANFQYYMIDGYICSPNVLVDSIETLDTGFDFSDHNPVKMVVTLSDEETVAKAIAENATQVGQSAEAEPEEATEPEEEKPEEATEPEEEKPNYVDEDEDGWDDITWEWIGYPDENGNYPDAEANQGEEGNTEEWTEG